ncbi:ABC transporter ATP-binding protein [Candidatus Bipolaricaulota bacterium]|nr:ABC transporter ATP-binding protein [Candidatus Bipolaricaulota bacterium]
MRIAIEHVSFSYDSSTPALRDADLAIAAATSIALIGPNGSGKSTLLKLSSGVLRPDQGRITLDGRPIGTLNPRQIARRVAMVAQERPMGFDFTVREVVAMGRIPHSGRFARESPEDRIAIEQAMRLADIGRLAERSIRAISGGERQRVYLGMALAQEPEILLLDEPTTHLDLRHQVQFMSIVSERVLDGVTALVAIHDLTLAAQSCDRIALFSEGQILATGTPKAVLTELNLERVFGIQVIVEEHPQLGTTYVLPRLTHQGRLAEANEHG